MVVDRDFFFPYSVNNQLQDSRNITTGLPIYSNNMKRSIVLDNLFSTQEERDKVEIAHQKGYRKFFDEIKNKNILSMNYCLEMDLTCSNAAREKYYNLLRIEGQNKSQQYLLTKNHNAIKKIENIDKIINSIPSKSLPESYNKIKNHFVCMIDELVIA